MRYRDIQWSSSPAPTIISAYYSDHIKFQRDLMTSRQLYHLNRNNANIKCVCLCEHKTLRLISGDRKYVYGCVCMC